MSEPEIVVLIIALAIALAIQAVKIGFWRSRSIGYERRIRDLVLHPHLEWRQYPEVPIDETWCYCITKTGRKLSLIYHEGGWGIPNPVDGSRTEVVAWIYPVDLPAPSWIEVGP